MKTFREFLFEMEDPLSPIKSAWDKMGVDHHISLNNNTITLSKIAVPKEHRNTGVGTSAMKILTSHADRHQHRIVLSPSGDFGGNKTRLKSFYTKHGFKENKGRNKDFSTRETMIREPKGD